MAAREATISAKPGVAGAVVGAAAAGVVVGCVGAVPGAFFFFLFLLDVLVVVDGGCCCCWWCCCCRGIGVLACAIREAGADSSTVGRPTDALVSGPGREGIGAERAALPALAFLLISARNTGQFLKLAGCVARQLVHVAGSESGLVQSRAKCGPAHRTQAICLWQPCDECRKPWHL